MSVLVDSSIWINYFRNAINAEIVDFLIDENLIVINDLILAELVPQLQVKKEKTIVAILYEIKKQPIHVDWNGIIQMQTECLHNGINGVGIPDLIIAQNSIQGKLELFSDDKHFSLISQYLPLSIYALK